ncbi:Acylphosphatase-like domain-containing protein [Podospora australis]|uniref:acylphosphatase n=1 Tax=Podospora australis TaxID=1536484 RepID=A0AAN6X4F2_9PEZI|nr:Acylphosphatase-like domain-containing protein [Podospora australis]
MATKRVYFLAHGGMVQGVGFRYFTRHEAKKHNLTGWVRNTDSNQVEGEAQGDDTALAEFLKKVNVGPEGSHVVKLDKEDRDPVDTEKEFVVRR